MMVKNKAKLSHLRSLCGLLLLGGVQGCNQVGQEENYHRSDVVKIDLKGHHFNVPMNYMHGESIEKRGYWPKPKQKRVKVDYLTIDVLLPEMKPYYPEDDQRWKVLGHGDKSHITIVEDKGNEKWFRHILEMTDADARQGRFYRKEESIYDLIHYSPRGTSFDEYYANDGRTLTIRCSQSQEVPFPSCTVKSSYVSGLGFDYYYSLRYLPQWREIDDKIRALFDQFQQAAQRESTAQTQEK